MSQVIQCDICKASEITRQEYRQIELPEKAVPDKLRDIGKTGQVRKFDLCPVCQDRVAAMLDWLMTRDPQAEWDQMSEKLP